MNRLVGTLCALWCVGCMAARNVRPVGEGRISAGLSVGGPMFTNLGGAIPTPLMTAYGRYGVNDTTDLDFGLSLPIVAAVGVDVGMAKLLLEERGARPALMAGGRLNFWANPYGLTGRKDANGRAFGLDPRLFEEVYGYASWRFGSLTPYVGLDVFAQLENASVRPTLLGGVDWRATRRFSLQVELKQMAFVTNQQYATVAFIGPGNYGALALNLGFNFHFGAGETP